MGGHLVDALHGDGQEVPPADADQEGPDPGRPAQRRREGGLRVVEGLRHVADRREQGHDRHLIDRRPALPRHRRPGGRHRLDQRLRQPDRHLGRRARRRVRRGPQRDEAGRRVQGDRRRQGRRRRGHAHPARRRHRLRHQRRRGDRVRRLRPGLQAQVPRRQRAAPDQGRQPPADAVHEHRARELPGVAPDPALDRRDPQGRLRRPEGLLPRPLPRRRLRRRDQAGRLDLAVRLDDDGAPPGVVRACRTGASSRTPAAT